MIWKVILKIASERSRRRLEAALAYFLDEVRHVSLKPEGQVAHVGFHGKSPVMLCEIGGFVIMLRKD